MKRALAMIAFAAAACARAPNAPREAPLSAAATAEQRYLGDESSRRRSLEASLVNPENGYSALRLAHYASGTSDDWDLLPEYNPKAAPFATPTEALAPLTISAAARAGDPEALRALGEAAFSRYPVQNALAAERLVKDETSAKRFGFWVDGGRIGGLVHVETPDGMRHLSYSCSTCHGGIRGGKLVTGVGSDTLDIGRLTVAAFPSSSDALLDWGPGRVDVTTNAGTEPVRIPDLRAVRDLAFLHHDGTLAQNDVTTLAIRIETLVIVSNSKTIRPPREVALGLAIYLWSIERLIPKRDSVTDSEKHGGALFATHCASCHVPPRYSGPSVALAEIGTDPHLGQSSDRGTGTYRVPSLRGVATRGPLLHDASVQTPHELLDPARLAPGYDGRRGPIQGHRYGLDLGREERTDLEAFLMTL
ncbi:hypothetical protein BH09MYX1_BH09MYX1_48510 [soil metagenome]